MTIERRARKMFWAAVIVTAINVTLAIAQLTQTVNAQTYTPRAKYLYKVVKTGSDEQSLQAVVDLFGRDGWELVTHYNDVLIFKK